MGIPNRWEGFSEDVQISFSTELSDKIRSTINYFEILLFPTVGLQLAADRPAQNHHGPCNAVWTKVQPYKKAE